MVVTAKLPEPFRRWFAGQGWKPHAHQLAVAATAQSRGDVLLVAPTGGGKTLAGFLPSLLTLADASDTGLHTLYVSPLKALTVDVHRNLLQPIADMALPINAETRTGDTPQARRQRQRRHPPHILLTTPESLALMLSYVEAPEIFQGLRQVVVDELHAIAGTKRGDLLALGLSRLNGLAPEHRRIGLSATVAWPDDLRAWLARDGDGGDVHMISHDDSVPPEISILTPDTRIPWRGHMGAHAMEAVYKQIQGAATTIVFVNTRAQAEIVFRHLWALNDQNLPIGLHHGSLAVEQRRRIEAAMAAGKLRAVVATSSLDLGVDWAAVDLVIQVGAPKGVSRLIQRVGRAGHRLDCPSRAVLVPANRFEVLECRAAVDAVAARTLDGDPPRPGGLDVLAQHILGTACSVPFDADALYRDVTQAAPYAALSRTDFDDTLAFVENGGYALKAYERYRRIRKGKDGRYRITSARVARLYRMNVGTIVEAVTMKVKLKKGRFLGEIEEYFILGLVPGDTFVFSGQVLRFVGLQETHALVERATGGDPKVPAYQGGRLPLTTHLADRVRAMLASPKNWSDLPEPVNEWLRLQRARSTLPKAKGLLVETFPRADKAYLVAYCFEGRNAHQTLGMLLTRRMERAGLAPLGFVATDYVLAIWSVHPATEIESLFDESMLGDDLEEWMDESSMLRRTFRNVAVIAGLIERQHPGERKTRRQVTFNADLIYDVLRRYDPNHILLRATRADAGSGLTDIRRVAGMLSRIRGRIVHRELDKVSPLAVPVLLEIGKETVYGAAFDHLLDEGEQQLIDEALALPGRARASA